MAVRIDLAEDQAALTSARAVFDAVWPGEGTQVTPNLLRALVHAGGYCSLAVEEDTGEAVGAALGFPARSLDLPGGVYLHSHMAAVRDDFRDRGIGTAIKRHQREWARLHDIPVVAWTFDPLVRRNARMNVISLGIEVRDYHCDFYGEMTDAINAGDRTDRLVAWWDVESDRAERAAAGMLAPASAGAARERGARDIVAVDAAGLPVVGLAPAPGGEALIALPRDIVALRGVDPGSALRWRMAVREGIGAAYEAGLRIDTVTDEGGYLLAPREWRLTR